MWFFLKGDYSVFYFVYGFCDYFGYIRDGNIIIELKKKKFNIGKKILILILNINVKMLCDLMWC